MIAGRQTSQQSQTAGRLHARGFLCLVVVLWLPGDPGHLLVRRNPRRSRAREWPGLQSRSSCTVD